MTTPTRPRMAAEDVLRGAWSLVGIVGLVILAVSLAGTFGAWAAGVLLLVAGALAAVPLWRRKLDADAARREVAAARKGQEPFRGVPPAQPADEEGGGTSYAMPG